MVKLIAREEIRDRIKAVFFDIDGTLVSFETHAVPASARRAIERLRQRGIKVFISTGRLLRHTEVVSDVEVDGYVTVNGSYCVTRGGETIFERSFPHDTVERIFGLCDEMGFQAAFMTHEDIYVDRLSERVLTIAEMIHIMPQVADLRRVASEQPCCRYAPISTSRPSGSSCPTFRSVSAAAGYLPSWISTCGGPTSRSGRAR